MQPELATRYRRNFPRKAPLDLAAAAAADGDAAAAAANEEEDEGGGGAAAARDPTARRAFHVIGLDVLIDEVRDCITLRCITLHDIAWCVGLDVRVGEVRSCRLSSDSSTNRCDAAARTDRPPLPQQRNALVTVIDLRGAHRGRVAWKKDGSSSRRRVGLPNASAAPRLHDN